MLKEMVLEIRLVSLQVGRKPKSKNVGLMQVVKLPFCQITYQPFFPKGAKREIRDKDGKLLYHARQMRMSINHFYYLHEGKLQEIPLFVQNKDVEITLKNLIKNGCKKAQS